MIEKLLVILLVGIVSLFGCGCIDTTQVDTVSEVEPTATPQKSTQIPEPTAIPTLPAPKYIIGDVVGDKIDAIAGCVVCSYNEVSDIYTIQIVGNKEGTWMYWRNENKRPVKRAELEEGYPILLARGVSLSDIPTLKAKDAKILSMSTTRDVFEWLHIVGEIENTGIETLEFVKVIATIYDKADKVIGVESTYTQPHTLKRGQVAPFEVICMGDIPTGVRYKLTVSWSE